MTNEQDRLFERFRQSGDSDALGRVFDATAPRLLQLAIHLVGDIAAAEDLVQATFVTAIERAATFDASRSRTSTSDATREGAARSDATRSQTGTSDAPSGLDAWLAGILANHARDLKKAARREIDVASLAERVESTPLENALQTEWSAALAQALDGVPEPYRVVLILRLQHSMTPTEIAHALQRSPGAVRVQLHRGREMLRKLLPAGILANAFFLAEPGRGLAHVKASITAHTAVVKSGVGVAGAVGGLLMSTKIVVAITGVVATFAILFLVRDWKHETSGTTVAAEPHQESVGMETNADDIGSPTGLSATAQRSGAVQLLATSAVEKPAAEAHRMTVRVLDVRGVPISGVTLKHRYGRRVGVTGPDGTLELSYVTRLDLGGIFPLFAEKNGYLTSTAPFPQLGASSVTIELADENPSVFVTILDAARIPKPGACVVLAPSQTPGPMPNQTLEEAAERMVFTSLLTDATHRFLAAASDDAGIATLSASPGAYTLLVYSPGYLRHEQQLDLSKPGALPQRLTITLSSGRELRGRVVDDRTDLPIHGARIWHPSSRCDLVSSDDRGEFSAVASEEPLDQRVWIFHPDYVPLLSEQNGYAVFRLRQGLVARLRFLDETNHPIPSPVRMEGMPPPGQMSDGRYAYFREASLDSNGDATISGIDPQLVNQLSFTSPGFARTSILVDPKHPMFTDERSVVTLRRESICRVKIVDEGGQRVEGCHADYTIASLLGGRELSSDWISLIEDEPGVFLLPSYLASPETKMELVARKGSTVATQIVKERDQPFPNEVTLTLQVK